MNLSVDLLFELLAERYHVERFGKGIHAKELSLPAFWKHGQESRSGAIYVAQTNDLPNKPPADCVFICCGTKPPKVWNMWPCEVIYVTDTGDNVLDIFNTMQAILDRFISWEGRMQRLQSEGAHISEMVEESIPLLENRITICDFELNILATCEYDEDHPEAGVYLSNRLERVPTYDIPSILDGRSSAIRNREPYFYNAPEGKETYCINFYLGDTYFGSCSLQAVIRPLTSLDLKLFQIFAGFVRDALALQTRTMGNQVVLTRAVFEQLLDGLPISQSEMSHALKMIELNMGEGSIASCKWCCVVIQNSHRGRVLPERYLCDTVESILPNATAIIYGDAVVAFCLIGGADHRVSEICSPLEAYLADMGFKAGISRTFLNPFHARSFYRQALCAIEMGFERDPDLDWYLFGSYALEYMLQQCCGEFDTELLVPPELVRLYRKNLPDVDYVKTLKVFLDNDCRIAKTATDLYLHRSTLVKRLEKIERFVNLDDAERRLYLRLCLHLPDIEQVLAASSDV